MRGSTDLTSATPDSLIAEFVDIALRQEEALFDMRTRAYNKLFNKMTGIVEELKRRGPEELGMLSSLYEHPSGQVRLKAAIYSLRIHPVEARRTLEELARRDIYPGTAEAIGILEAYDSGRYTPI